jgi:uncharacterized protein DUF5658
MTDRNAVTETETMPEEGYDPHMHGERRRSATRPFSRFTLFGGRRRSRSEETYTDLYGPRVFAALLAICALNVLDSFFTLVYLQRGGSEANPIADLMIRQSGSFFVFWKTFVLGNALAILCLHKNFRRARYGILAGAAIYVVLTVYHLFLFFREDVGLDL